MVHHPWMFILHLLSIFSGAFQTNPIIGNCTKPNSSSSRCCIGYFLSDNKCLECEPGYLGTNCSRTCPSGYFGRRCLGLCNCSLDMYCDPARGCLCNITSGNCSDQEKESTKALTTVVSPTARLSVKMTDEGEEKIEAVAVPFLIPVIALLVFGTVCIRIRYSQILKRRTDSTVRNHRSETDESNPNDDIYDHLNLRVHHSNHSIYHAGSMAATGDTTSGSCVPLQQAQSEESIQNTRHLHEWDFQRHEDGISESLVDEPHRETVNDKTTDQQANIYSTPCKRITKKPLSCCSQQGQQKSCDKL